MKEMKEKNEQAPMVNYVLPGMQSEEDIISHTPEPSPLPKPKKNKPAGNKTPLLWIINLCLVGSLVGIYFLMFAGDDEEYISAHNPNAARKLVCTKVDESIDIYTVSKNHFYFLDLELVDKKCFESVIFSDEAEFEAAKGRYNNEISVAYTNETRTITIERDCERAYTDLEAEQHSEIRSYFENLGYSCQNE
jgi:hypothetical protein